MLYCFGYSDLQNNFYFWRFQNMIMVDDRRPGVRGKPPAACLFLVAALAAPLMSGHDAQAQGAFGAMSPSFNFSPSMNFYAPYAEPSQAPRPRVYIRTHSPRRYSGAEQRSITSSTANSFCVRTCDGRFFPVPKVKDVSDVKACEAVCPSAEIRVYSGADIDNATSERGLAYTKLVNAFRFRREMVPSCTCNARDEVGLTRVSIENDPTVRTGDIVAQEDGFAVASEGSSGRPRMIFRPLSHAKAKALGLIRISAR